MVLSGEKPPRRHFMVKAADFRRGPILPTCVKHAWTVIHIPLSVGFVVCLIPGCVVLGSLVSIAMPCQLKVLAYRRYCSGMINTLRSSFGIADHLLVIAKADFSRGVFRRHTFGSMEDRRPLSLFSGFD